MDAQVKKIVRRWSTHIIYVFVAIIIVFFNLSFADIVSKQTADSALTGYSKLLEEFLKALPKAANPIAFLLIFCFLCLIFYTSYIIIRISRRIFQSPCFTSFELLFLPILSNCIFVILIGLITNHCLEGNITTSLSLSMLHNFFLQLFVIIPIIIIGKCRCNLIIVKIIEYILLIASLVLLVRFLYYNKELWAYETINPAIKYFSRNNYPKLHKVINFAINKSVYWRIPLVLYPLALWYIIKPSKPKS